MTPRPLLAALAFAALGCDRPAWRAASEETPEGAAQGMARVMREAAEDRELAFDEALHPGRLAARRRARLATGELSAFRRTGEELFALDAPWSGGDPRPVSPLHAEGGPATPDATRCVACHHQGGPGGSGSFADVAFFDARGDDVWSARRRLPPMLAGAALLELAAMGDEARHPFGWAKGRPRRLREMVRWSAATHLAEAPTEDEVDALTVFVALIPPPRRASPAKDALVLRAQRGAEVFVEIGCAGCHVERLEVKSPVLALAGGRRLDLSAQLSETGAPPFAVHAYSDLAVHHLGDELAEREGADRDVWVTAPLWGLASRATFLHDGRATTADEAIRAHGGEAAAARDAYLKLQERRADLDLFLTTLGRAPVMVWMR